MKKLLVFLFVAVTLTGFSQKIKLVEGSLKGLQGVTNLNYEFSYEGIKVGEFDEEQKYIARKKADYNAKEAGKGEEWEKNWFNDRNTRFEPRFIESFGAAGFTAKADSEYTLIFNTTYIEPGFNVGVWRKPAYINGIAVLVKTSDKSHAIAKFTVDKAPGRDVMGFDYDTGLRLTESYATAGKRLGRFIAKEQGR